MDQATLGATNTMFSEKNPGNLVWYEFGDGKFTFKPRFNHVYANGSNLNSAVLKLSGIYETGGKPTRIITNGSFRNTSTIGFNNYLDEANDPLTSGYNVKISSNVSAIKSGDTMHFAIDYFIPNEDPSWKLVFEYNLGEDKHFLHTNTNNRLVDYTIGVTNTPFIRTHHNENIYVSSNRDRIEFTNLIFNNRPKTVFVSLVGVDDKGLEGYTGALRAYLINAKSPTPSKANEDISSLRNIADKPHDPNYIKAVPKCVKTNKANKVQDYHIHFQNTGIGNADDLVKVSVKLPNMVTGAQFSPTPSGLSVTCADIPIINFAAFNVLTPPSAFSPNTVYYDNISHSDSIHFLIKYPNAGNRIILKGMDSTKPNFMNDTKTMGDIKFKLTLPKYPQKTELYALASIVFDTEDPVLTDPFITLVRKRCGKRKKADCNCGTSKKTFLNWLKEACD
jgi:hypothetical protein